MSEEDKKYWEKRAEDRLVSAEKKALRFEKHLKKSFEKVYQNIENEIANLYFRYADENGIEYSEVKKRLTPKEIEQFKKEMRYRYETAKTEEQKERIKGYYQNVVSRLDAKKANLRAEVDRFYAEEFDSEFQITLEDVYKDSFYKTIWDTQVMLGFSIEFDRVSKDTLRALLDYPWSGKNYSEKLWGHINNFGDKLEEILTVGIIQGKSNQEIARSLAKTCDAQYKNALRLVRTETNFASNEASAKAYESQGVEEYQYLSALDLRTSDICRRMDGKVFKLSEKAVGKNYPPLHPHCRSTTVPYFPDLEGTRIARGHDGKNYKVDKNMNYEEWYEKFVKGNPEAEREEKKIKNKSKDRKQLEKYQHMLGKNAPKSLEEFQNIKYNEHRYSLLKNYAKAMSKEHISKSTNFSYYEQIDAEITKVFKGIITANGIKIEGHSLHFIDRIIGNEDEYINKKGKVLKKRDPVKINEALETILKPDKIGNVKIDRDGRISQTFTKEKCAMVSINPKTKKLVQTNKK